MKSMKKLLLAALLVLPLCFGVAYAENHVSDIEISAVLCEDGSARITQIWQGYFEEGTENYIPIATEDIGIKDLKVTDEKGSYTLEEPWDVEASFQEKSRKCGILETQDGVELCFGISDYGEKSYTIEYVVTDFIKAYSDYDGTNFMFINPYMSTFPTNGTIRMVLEDGTALNENNAGIWAFGFDGEIWFQNGAVVARTTSALKDENAMIVMLRLNKGILSPKTVASGSFAQLQSEAFEGSDYGYGKKSLFDTVVIFGVMFLILALLVLFLVFYIKRKKAIKGFYKQVPYFRDVPNGGDMEMSHFLAHTFDVSGEESLIIGALMLSMINQGQIEPQTEERAGMFGGVQESVNLKLLKAPEKEAERKLYEVLCQAAGPDGILQEKELEKYAGRHPESVQGVMKSAKDRGESALIHAGGFVSGSGNCIKDLTEKGKAELSQVMGLKKYLEDFSLIAERGIKETIIWKDYLVYATLFGIADKVIDQLEKVYPDKLPELESYHRSVLVVHHYHRSMHTAARRAMQQQRTSGMGGRASFGGGGGFSGGGRGGGSR